MFAALKAKYEKINIDRLLFIFAIIGTIIYHLSMTLTHIPTFDEANAWNIANNFNFSQILDLTKYEGHTFLWYTLIMPFAKTNFFYPYSIEILNWCFGLGAVILLWKYAPFNSWIKLFITFSSPMRIYFTFARCYAIGILLIFSICALYPKRIKHPLWYSLLLIILANTSVMGAIFAFSFGIIFCFDLYSSVKNRCLTIKDVALSVGICLLGAIILLAQLLGFHVPYYVPVFIGSVFFAYYFQMSKLLFIFVHIMLMIFLGRSLKNGYKHIVFCGISYFLLLTLFTLIYSGDVWHYSFLYVALMVTVWLYMAEHKIDYLSGKVYMVGFGLFCLLLAMAPSDFPEGGYTCYKDYIIENVDTFKNKKIFLVPMAKEMSAITPYLREYDLKFYDKYGNDAKSLDAYKDMWFNDPINFGKIYELIGNDKEAYFFVSVLAERSNLNSFLTQVKSQNKLSVSIFKYIYPAVIYKITK